MKNSWAQRKFARKYYKNVVMEKEKINYRKPILEFQCQSEGNSRKKKKTEKNERNCQQNNSRDLSSTEGQEV